VTSSDNGPAIGGTGEGTATGSGEGRQSRPSENDDIAPNMNENGVQSASATDAATDFDDSLNDASGTASENEPEARTGPEPGDEATEETASEETPLEETAPEETGEAEAEPVGALEGVGAGDEDFSGPAEDEYEAGDETVLDPYSGTAYEDAAYDEGGEPTVVDDDAFLPAPGAAAVGATAPSFVPPEIEEADAGAEAGWDGGGPSVPEKERSRAARYGRRALLGMLGFLALCAAAFGVAYLMTPVPSPQEQALAQGPTFYYSDGKTVIAKTGVNRDTVPIDEIPQDVRDAVIAAENRSFYRDPGVSLTGTTRAFWSTVTGEQLQGGSTITQQMVRNYYGGIGTERSLDRKLKEVMVALKVGREKPKDWILEQYLNTIYFGRDAYGVQAAARAYYGKDVDELTAREGAFLAAAIQQPSNFADPSGPNRAHVEHRWRAIVSNMVKDGSLTQAQADKMTFPMPDKQKSTDILKGQNGYMVNVAKKELIERRGYTEDEINRAGLKIVTTFDRRLMDAAKEAVTSNAPKGMSKRIRTGLVSVDPATGQVLAFYGGRDYLKEALSSSFGDWAQAGSGFKPIVLAAALEDGVRLYDSFDGSSPQYYNGKPVKNNEGRSYGYVNLVGATQNSVNTAYVNVGRKIGNNKVVRMAEKMGIPRGQLTANDADNAATFPLGVISMHPVQQAGVYATFAAEGVHRTPYVVKAVSDNNGDHKRSFSEKGKRVFSERVARDATYAMSRVVRSGTGTAAQLPDGRDVAGKTGTTDEGRAIWFNGFIPQMATTVSMFRSDGKPLKIPGYGVYGGVLPAQMWQDYTSDAVDIKRYEPKNFGRPSVNTGGGRFDHDPSDRPGQVPPRDPDEGRPTDPEEPEEPSAPPTPEEPIPSLPAPTLPDPEDPGGGEPPGGGGGDGDGGSTGGPRPNG
jgi:membrane peptidoglycan carboxypeptidase